MALTTTSNGLVDQHIADALTPTTLPPFEQLWDQAQQTLNRLAQSLFFRRYLLEKIEALGEGHNFLRLARDSRNEGAEWLVLTEDCQLRFWIVGSGSLYNLAEINHDPFLMRKACLRLSAMDNEMNAMRLLISRFGEPRFTKEEIEAEMKRNGQVRVTFIGHLSLPESQYLREISMDPLVNRLKKLQFEVETTNRIFSYEELRDRDLSPANNGHDIFILFCHPLCPEKIMRLFNRFPKYVRQRLWIVAHPCFITEGFSRELLAYPMTHEIEEESDADFLTRLAQMFNN